MTLSWPSRRWYVVVALGAATAVLAGVLLLRPVEVSASPGVVVGMQTTLDGHVTLEIEVSGVNPGDDYQVLLASAPDQDTRASIGLLGQITADEFGVGTLTASGVTIAAGAQVPLQEEMFHAPGALLAITSRDGATVAEVQVIGAPTDAATPAAPAA